MESKKLVALLVVCLLLTSSGLLIGSAIAGTAVPLSDDILIHTYLHPDPENLDLEAGILDLNDWPLAKEWVDRWSIDPNIQLRAYSELGMMEIDIYNARWPTGCPYHHQDDERFGTCARCRAAREFRKAVAYLTNKEKYCSVFMKGYGIRLDFPMPPFQSEFLPDPGTATIYYYNPTLANTTFYNAGFWDWDGDGVREWKKPAGYPTDPGGNTGATYEELPACKFWVRMDDPNRKAAGEDLAAELLAQGIPLDVRVTEKSTCFKNVMVIYDYNLYTGGWGLSTLPDTYYDLYSEDTYYYPVGWSLNYPGWCNSTFYTQAVASKYPSTRAGAIAAAKQCGVIASQSVPVVWMWTTAAVTAYRTGWTGVINYNGFGVYNGFTWHRMTHATDKTMDWGFKNNIEQLNRISSEWIWDDMCLDRMYEGLYDVNPFTLKTEFPLIAEDYAIDTWYNPMTGDDGTYLNFTLRTSGVDGLPRPTFHNVTGGARRAVTAQDVEFSIDFAKITGAGNCFYVTLVLDVNSTWCVGDTLHIRMNHESIWAYDWMSGCAILNPDLWNNIEDGEGDKCGWTPSVGPGDDPHYNPAWRKAASREYDPAADDANENGVYDIFEDGTGPFIYNASTTTSVYLIRDPAYYLTLEYIDEKITMMFHYGYGDIDNSTRVESVDLGAVVRAVGTGTGVPAPPIWPPPGWGVYNDACDLYTSPSAPFDDNYVNTADLTLCALNYGQIVG